MIDGRGGMPASGFSPQPAVFLAGGGWTPPPGGVVKKGPCRNLAIEVIAGFDPQGSTTQALPLGGGVTALTIAGAPEDKKHTLSIFPIFPTTPKITTTALV